MRGDFRRFLLLLVRVQWQQGLWFIERESKP